jgi:hypothetical protein
MSKYKLIKEYPNSPELGFITDETMHFPASYPEFWEKIKDWEIHEYYDLMLIMGHPGIKSVKRLSDNTIFSVGDKVDNFYDTIVEFEVTKDDNIRAILKRKDIINTVGLLLNSIKKERKIPILMTEDGVDLFEGDEFWHVDTYFYNGKGVLNNAFKPLKGYRHFSTEKAAKDWVEMNKPQFSKNDLAKKGIGFFYVDGQEIWKIDLSKLK